MEGCAEGRGVDERKLLLGWKDGRVGGVREVVLWL